MRPRTTFSRFLGALVWATMAMAAVLGSTSIVAQPHAAAHPTGCSGTSIRGNAPINDLCTSVTAQALPAGGSLTFTGDNTGATMDGDYTPGGILESEDLPSVWHAFTTTECGHVTVSYCGTSPAFMNNWLVLVKGCPGSDTLVYNYSWNRTSCGDENATILFMVLPAGTYYLPVVMDDGTDYPAQGPYTVLVSSVPCVIQAPNDDCINAIAVPVSTYCDYVVHAAGGTTESLPAVPCNGSAGNANDDVWFSFVATTEEMTISAIGSDDGDGNNLTGYDVVLELLDACAGTSLACADATWSAEAEVIETTGLVIGATYYFRVYNYFTAIPSPNTFGVCVIEGLGIGIQEEAQIATSGMFPNPAGDEATLLLLQPLDGQGVFILFDASGAEVLRHTVPSGTPRMALSTSSLAQGLYHYQVYGPAGAIGDGKLMIVR